SNGKNCQNVLSRAGAAYSPGRTHPACSSRRFLEARLCAQHQSQHARKIQATSDSEPSLTPCVACCGWSFGHSRAPVGSGCVGLENVRWQPVQRTRPLLEGRAAALDGGGMSPLFLHRTQGESGREFERSWGQPGAKQKRRRAAAVQAVLFKHLIAAQVT